MNYELAKQLWEAGYSMSVKNSQAFSEEDSVVSYPTPTLSELISACGEVRFHMWRTEKNQWCAVEGLFQKDSKVAGMKFGDLTADAPEEAVAKLWLALAESRKANEDAQSNRKEN